MKGFVRGSPEGQGLRVSVEAKEWVPVPGSQEDTIPSISAKGGTWEQVQPWKGPRRLISKLSLCSRVQVLLANCTAGQ